MKKETIVLSIILVLGALIGFQLYKQANLPKPQLNDSKTPAVYSDQHIAFEYPIDWKINHARQFNDPFIINVDFIGECNIYRVISFAYKITDPNDPESFVLGQRNPYGPGN